MPSPHPCRVDPLEDNLERSRSVDVPALPDLSVVFADDFESLRRALHRPEHGYRTVLPVLRLAMGRICVGPLLPSNTDRFEYLEQLEYLLRQVSPVCPWAPLPSWVGAALEAGIELVRASNKRAVWMLEMRSLEARWEAVAQPLRPRAERRVNLDEGFRRAPLERFDLQTFLRPAVGPITALEPRVDTPDPLAISAARLRAPSGQTVFGIGRADNFRDASRIATLEALERHAGLSNRTGTPTVRANWLEVSERAVHPGTLGLYTPDQYRRADFPCRAFVEHKPLEWVEGFDLQRQRPVLIPADFVFYDDPSNPDPLVIETSSGCALGSKLGEAFVHGVLELIERDAALRWWYDGAPATRVDWRPCSAKTRWLRARIEHLGFEVRACRVSGPTKLPVVVAVALGRSASSAAALCASGAHFTVERALGGALVELAAMSAWGRSLNPDQLERSKVLAAHPERIGGIGDHLLLSASSAVRSVVEERFLNAGVESNAETPVFATVGDVVNHLQECGLGAIVVDQTPPELEAANLTCARAIVPGLIPMHYGAGLERGWTHGLPNGLPHPFS